MGYVDITRPLFDGMPVYPGDAPCSIIQNNTGETAIRTSALSFNSHCGTHLDAPRHFFTNGAGVDDIQPEVLCGPCRVVNAAGYERITPELIVPLPADMTQRILFKTGDTPENGQYTCLTEEAAALLVERSCRLVGLEAMSADRPGAGKFPVHRILLGNGLCILESIDLSRVPEGTYDLICAPLNIRNGDGAPARVLLKTG